jgi:hypothetical protein
VVVGGLRHAVGADHGVRDQAADRADDDEAAAGLHARQGHGGEPERAFHVVRHDLVELVVGDAGEGAVVGVRRRVRHDDVDAAPLRPGRVDQRLQLLLARHVAGHGEDVESLLLQVGLRCLAGIGLAGGDGDLGPAARQLLGDRLADAAGRACDEGDLAAQIEQRRFHVAKSGMTKLTDGRGQTE